MQFHQDGFRPGDPAIADPVAALPPTPEHEPLPAEVDVLIVGSGPTGLTLAAQLAAFPDISVALVEAKPGPLTVGQADGIACRSVEMFHAFGFAHKVLHEAYWVNETVFWKPDPDAANQVRRSHRIQDVEDGLSEMPHVILNQARVHDFFLEVMRNAERPIIPYHSRRFVDLDKPSGGDSGGDDNNGGDSNRNDGPVVAHFESPDGSVESVRARFVVGCDGARSQVRRSMGRRLVGDAANQAWGVMDVLGVTDFPDIRFKVIMHAEAGNMVIIPREGGYMVRLYIEMGKLEADERAADRNVSLDHIVDAANRILHPYTLQTVEVPWWSVYEIGQRLCDRFDDLEQEADLVETAVPRVFIAGDACHTHSPKAGQGMNVSMRDGYNLGWKLASVLRGRADPAILNTYSDERHAVAKELIDFDRELATMMSSRPKASDDDEDGVDPSEFARYFQQSGRFMAGVATRYEPSLLTAAQPAQELAKGFTVGMRFHSAPVARIADGKVVELGQTASADGRWRFYAFADAAHPGHTQSRLGSLCRFLIEDERSPLLRYTPAGENVDAVFDVRGVIQQSYHDIAIHDLPSLLAPRSGRLSLIDYEKAFGLVLQPGPDIYDLRGINREEGALVLVRPDQHVAHILALDDFDGLAEFFAEFLIPPSD